MTNIGKPDLPTLLLADLHLPAQPSPLRDTFIRFLEGPARQARRILILGDLFEYWIGDDVGLQVYATEVSRLAALTAHGVDVAFMHGNRDFLVGSSFAGITGVAMLPDPQVVDLHGTPTLVSHGDAFCSDDPGYQRWRRFSRRPAAQWIFLHLPRRFRKRIAGGLRDESSRKTARKSAEIMDVNETAIRAAFTKYGVGRIIHGHTHRPAEHHYGIGDNRGERVVLADWRPQRMEYLEVTAAGLRRVNLL